MNERNWRYQTEEERAEDCPTGGIIPIIAGAGLMAFILLLVCYA